MSSLPTTMRRSRLERIEEIRVEQSVDEYLKGRYQTTHTQARSLYGKVVVGTRSDGTKEICKISDKRRLRISHLSEDPLMEIHVMKELTGCTGHVSLIDAFEDERHIVMVMEFVDGGDLYDFVSKGGGAGLSVEEATDLTRQLCEALSGMHARGFCHLDVSLENILIDSSTHTIRLCDYGLARKFPSGNRRFAGNRIRTGKKGYNTPEMMTRRPFDGELADVWAVAVVFWILLTGHPPFGSAHASDIYFESLFNRDCAYLLQKCRLLDRIPEKTRRIFNAIFVDEEERIGLAQLCEMLERQKQDDVKHDDGREREEEKENENPAVVNDEDVDIADVGSESEYGLEDIDVDSDDDGADDRVF